MSGPPFTIERFDHIVLRVRDMPTMERFYCNVLGCYVAKRQNDGTLVHLRNGTIMIDLVDSTSDIGRCDDTDPSSRGCNMDHMCLRIEPFNEANIANHARTHGVQCGSVARRFGAEGWGPSIYIEDPEGNTIELKGRNEDYGAN